MHVLHVTHKRVPAGEPVLTPLVLAEVLLVVDLAVKQHVLDPGVGKVAETADDLANVGRDAAADVDDVVGVQRFAVRCRTSFAVDAAAAAAATAVLCDALLDVQSVGASE